MADNLIQKSHKTSEKNKFNNVVHRTTSESLRLNESEKGVTHPTSLQAAHNPRKISSFQITSVTVGSRVSTDAGEDSADDLDESHTDDISRITDIENETPSYSEDTFSKDDVFYNASSASLACAPVIPTSSQYGLAIVGQDGAAPAGAVPNSNSQEVTDMHVSVTNAGTGSIINLIGNAKPQEGMKEIQEHVRNERFKVVKIESTEPFRRGRWVCMDYLDHTSTQQNAPITLNNNLDMTESNALQAPDSGVVMNDCQHEETPNDLINKGPKDVQGNAPTMQQLEQTLQKQFPIASPGQSLTQPLNSVQQHMPVNQSVSVQSPPLEMPQQMGNQNMAGSQQVAQQHPQSMTHITLQGAAPSHAAPGHAAPGHAAAPPSHAPAGPLHVPQSFPQHHLQQVIAAHQALQQQMPMHQQMQQMPNQQMQQMGQHMQQPQMTNMQQMQPMPQMQAMPAQGQMQQVPNQQPQMQQMQMQQMQGQNSQQMNMQQAQMPSMGAGHHMQGQQAMQGQQPQLQQLSNQAQMQAMQGQQMPNHMQQMQMPTNQQMPQMQPQMHQMPAQAQQQVVGGMHPQMQQQSMPGVQQQYNTVSQSNQAMLGAGMPAAPPQLVAQYHAPPAQGQTLPQEVLSGIVTSQQGATLPGSLQPLVSQPQGSTLPASLQMAGAPQQAGMQMMSAPQNMQMTLDGNQPNMQMPASEQMYMQSGAVGHMLPQPVGAQYVPGQAVPQMAHQSMPMAMQAPSMPVMSGAVHPAVVQSQSSMGLGYGGVAAVMSQSSVAPAEVVSGTNSPVVSLPAPYAGAPLDAQGFGSPVSAVSASVVNASDSAPSDAPPEPPPDAADGKEDQAAPPTEDESASGTSAVAIDNKIEQAMDLVKSHLMFAVREEVEVLKERIAELMERINQLEVENSFLRAHAASDTLAALPGARAAPGPAPPAS